MTGMALHARKDWTSAQIALGAACAVIGLAIAVLGFLDIYLTVTHLLHPIWGDWSWTVIVLGEGSFAGCYLGWLLMVLRDKPPTRTRVFLIAYMSAFGALSLLLNLYAGRSSIPGLASHAVVVGAFFGYLLFAKVLVHRLSADPSARALEMALADARRHAVDLVRDRKGILWHHRVPSLLRRQIRSGRLPDEVRSEVEMKVSMGRTSGWEATVRAWVFRELRIDLIAAAADEQAAREIAREAAQAAIPAAPQPALEAAPAVTPEATPQPAARTARSATPKRPAKPSPSAVKKMSGSDLAPYVGTLLETTPGMTPSDVMRMLKVGREKAAEALRVARKDRFHVAAEG